MPVREREKGKKEEKEEAIARPNLQSRSALGPILFKITIVHCGAPGSSRDTRLSIRWVGELRVFVCKTSFIILNKTSRGACVKSIHNFLSFSFSNMEWRRSNRSLWKCTHLYDETQGTRKHKRFRQNVFVGCKKIEICLRQV